MDLSFIILAGLVLAGAAAAMSLQNLVHCALSAAGAFIGLAGIYLKLGAQFIGFAQVLVYVGAIAILVLFVILLTRGPRESPSRTLSPGWGWGAAVAVAGFGLLGFAVMLSGVLPVRHSGAAPVLTVRQIGDLLMSRYVLALEAIALLLTAALLGAVVLAMRDPGSDRQAAHPTLRTDPP